MVDLVCGYNLRYERKVHHPLARLLVYGLIILYIEQQGLSQDTRALHML